MQTRILSTAKMALAAARTSLGAALLLTGLGAMATAQTAPIPEIDAGSAVTALALLSGGVMLLKDRFRGR